MKSKTLRYIGLPLMFLLLLWFIARITGMLQFYKTRAGSMEPALFPGKHMIITNLKKPQRNDIIAYKRMSGEKEGVEPGIMQNYCSRLIAFEGETVEIKNGLAYVNGQLVDDSTTLYFPFEFEGKNAAYVADALNIDIDELTYDSRLIITDNNHAILTCSYQEIASLDSAITFIRTKAMQVDNLYGAEGKNWSIDNYGPVTIPKGHFFYLGDNRHLSLDARFTGPLPLKNIKGVKL